MNIEIVSRARLLSEISKIINFVNENKNNPELVQKTRVLFMEGIKMKHINEYTGEEENIFNIPLRNGTNLFIMSCVSGLTDLSKLILRDFRQFFNLGHITINYRTALIITILKNQFDIAQQIIDFPFRANLGQQDINNKTALDYMLEKFKNSKDKKRLEVIDPRNTDKIIEMSRIISELIKFYLFELIRNPADQMAQSYIDIFCSERKLWRPLLSHFFDRDQMDFEESRENHQNKICDKFEVDDYVSKGVNVTTSTPLRNTRTSMDFPIASTSISQPQNRLIQNIRFPNQEYQLIPKLETTNQELEAINIQREQNRIAQERARPLTPSINTQNEVENEEQERKRTRRGGKNKSRRIKTKKNKESKRNIKKRKLLKPQ